MTCLCSCHDAEGGIAYCASCWDIVCSHLERALALMLKEKEALRRA